MVLLVLGALIITPLLGFMSTGLIAGQANEESMAGIYAADAGIEDAIWHIQTRDENLPTAAEPTPWQYNLTEELNIRQVSNTIDYINDHTFKVTATATKDGSSVTVVL